MEPETVAHNKEKRGTDTALQKPPNCHTTCSQIFAAPMGRHLDWKLRNPGLGSFACLASISSQHYFTSVSACPLSKQGS